ncbi:hypothetical protein QVD17_30946 [Tagetes erecta]|uniref:Uncharacterized protein n=1 Tax=Tagetes erecta TaxID=13708 RepID=A0AAD8NMS9_TARER|nr:hypothetical protein QVD17_30946 [Tagetes erecta]
MVFVKAKQALYLLFKWFYLVSFSFNRLDYIWVCGITRDAHFGHLGLYLDDGSGYKSFGYSRKRICI